MVGCREAWGNYQSVQCAEKATATFQVGGPGNATMTVSPYSSMEIKKPLIV